jgi:hypothetical protein
VAAAAAAVAALCPCSQVVMFGMYALITWFGGLELSSCRSTFDGFLKSFFAVLFSVMGLAQAQVRHAMSPVDASVCVLMVSLQCSSLSSALHKHR